MGERNQEYFYWIKQKDLERREIRRELEKAEKEFLFSSDLKEYDRQELKHRREIRRDYEKLKDYI